MSYIIISVHVRVRVPCVCFICHGVEYEVRRQLLGVSCFFQLWDVRLKVTFHDLHNKYVYTMSHLAGHLSCFMVVHYYFKNSN